MSEQNKDKELDRENWLKHDQPSPADGATAHFSSSSAEPDEWEKRALRGRSLLPDEATAESLLRDLDEAIDSQYGTTIPAVLPERKLRPLRWWGVAAAVVLLLLAGWWFWPRPSGADLYSAYFSHRTSDLATRTMGAGNEDELARILLPYDAHRYDEAVESIGSYLQQHPEMDALRLYYAISLLENNRTEEAITQLGQLKQTQLSSDYLQAADWYLSLAYLKAGQEAAAKAILQTIAGSTNPYQAQAKALLGAL